MASCPHSGFLALRCALDGSTQHKGFQELIPPSPIPRLVIPSQFHSSCTKLSLLFFIANPFTEESSAVACFSIVDLYALKRAFKRTWGTNNSGAKISEFSFFKPTGRRLALS